MSNAAFVSLTPELSNKLTAQGAATVRELCELGSVGIYYVDGVRVAITSTTMFAFGGVSFVSARVAS